eukprot:6593569-Ditylum_brightwellii.AAC.2
MTGFDLHSNNCKHNYKRDMQAVTFASDPDESQATKGKLYDLNNTSKADQAKFLNHGPLEVCPIHLRGPDH